MMPSALGIPDTTPSADSRASSSPLSTVTSSPQRRPTSRTKASPLVASRTAAVAMKAGCSTPIPRASRPNRAIAPRARSAASSPIPPVFASSPPSPHTALSLNIGTGARR